MIISYFLDCGIIVTQLVVVNIMERRAVIKLNGYYFIWIFKSSYRKKDII